MKARHEFDTQEAYDEYILYYYAGLAMQGLLSKGWNVYEYESAGRFAVAASHALIKALNEKP
jgi:hypothetical protein